MSAITKCLFPVAGYGTRFLPATKAIPKEMLPVLVQPLIQYGVEEAMSAGMTTMAMVTSKHKQAIKNHFEPHADIEASIKGTAKASLLDEVNHISQQCDFTYIEQQQMLGLGHAIYTGKPLIGNEPFAVILPDDLCTNNAQADAKNSHGDSVLKQMTKLYKQYPDCCIVAIEEVPETPKSNYAVTGLYFYPNDVVNKAVEVVPSDRGELEITTVNQMYLSEERLTVELMGRGYAWLDTGTHESLLEASTFIETIERRQGLKVACIEEIAFEQGYISKEQLIELAQPLAKNQYGQYLLRRAEGIN